MYSYSAQIGLKGVEVWALVVPTGDGLRLRLDLADWRRLALSPGQGVPVRLPGRRSLWLVVETATEVPPVAWVTLSRAIRAAA